MKRSQRPERKRTIETVGRALNRLEYEYETLLEIGLTHQEEEEEFEQECEEAYESTWIGPGPLVYKDCNAAHAAKLKDTFGR